jgi:hypothetical protein
MAREQVPSITAMTTPYPPAVPPASRTSGMAIAGFVCSFFCGLLGLIFSIMGRNECKRSGGTIGGEGLALAGIIISCVSLALGILGMLAAIAIPAFMDSMAVTRKTEAMIQLDKIGKRATLEFMVNAEFPRQAAPLTPAVDCCSQNARGKRKCAVVPSDWNTPEWRALDFSMDREFYYQYSYEPLNDGTEFVARAVGDRDCDGTKVTFELRGKIVAGDPRVELISPPPNAD